MLNLLILFFLSQFILALSISILGKPISQEELIEAYISRIGNSEILTQNINLFPMRDWHVKHMQDTIVKYLTGLSENATRWQKRLDKKYGNLTQVTKRIDYDLKHGVEKQEVLAFLELIKTDQSYSELRKANDFGYRFDSLEADFLNRDSKANHSLSFTDY